MRPCRRERHDPMEYFIAAAPAVACPFSCKWNLTYLLASGPGIILQRRFFLPRKFCTVERMILTICETLAIFSSSNLWNYAHFISITVYSISLGRFQPAHLFSIILSFIYPLSSIVSFSSASRRDTISLSSERLLLITYRSCNRISHDVYVVAVTYFRDQVNRDFVIFPLGNQGRFLRRDQELDFLS